MPPLSIEAIAAAANAVVQLSAPSTDRSTQPRTSCVRSHIPPQSNHGTPYKSTTDNSILSRSSNDSTTTQVQASRVGAVKPDQSATPPSPLFSEKNIQGSSSTSTQTDSIQRSPRSSRTDNEQSNRSCRLPVNHISASASVFLHFAPVNYSGAPQPPHDLPSSVMSGNSPAHRIHGRSLSLSHADTCMRTVLPSGPMHIGQPEMNASDQLMQLSQLASIQNRMSGAPGPSQSRKRPADAISKIEPSPKRYSHVRHHSTVSLGSASVGKIGELSAELKTRLSYAMMKVNHGWQSHSIDEVESLASQVVSPSSTNSIPRCRPDSSISPALSSTGKSSADLTSTPASQESRSQHSSSDISTNPTGYSIGLGLDLAPPVSIQPSTRQFPPPSWGKSSSHPTHLRRHSRAGYTPTLLSHNSLPLSSPQTSSTVNSRRLSCSQIGSRDNMFSPHQNVREQDAIETLLFMSSPGNTANLKNSYVGPLASPGPNTPRQGQAFGSISGSISASSSQLQFTHTSSGQNSTQTSPRHVLPNSQPRKNLPSQRLAVPAKRVGIDSPIAEETSPNLKRRFSVAGVANGSQMKFTTPLALDKPLQVRQRLADEDIDKMLEQVAAEDSEDDYDEIQIPRRVYPHAQAVQA